MFASLRIFIIAVLSIGLAACSQTAGGGAHGKSGYSSSQKHKPKKLTRAEQRKKAEADRQLATFMTGLALVGATAVIGAAASRGGRHSGYGDYSHGNGGGSYGGNDCGIQVWTPNPRSPVC